MIRRRPPQAKTPRTRSDGGGGPCGSPQGRDDFLIVGIGASAGGLDACRRLVESVPASNDMTFIFVQHLDPTHESLMVELLATHTTMAVQQAADGMRIERDHLYVIPPGTYLSVGGGALHLSEPQARHGARLPFDFLLRSLAEEYGERTVCVILSGTGADGSLGLKAVKENGGLVIAQDPDEAAYDGMPRNAILTGAVDLVLPLAKISNALAKYDLRMSQMRTQNGSHQQGAVSKIIDLLRATTAHDFRLYKPGTLQRRIERRMAMAAVESGGMDRYLEILRNDASELDLLAKDLLINVTSFFRDPKVFALLAEKIIPELIRIHSPDRSLRIWIAGCSTGEETYSLAMVFYEQIAATKRNIKLQVFASDIDGDAVAIAREGLYPTTIEAEVSPERLARFFIKEDEGYRVSQELRVTVVFTVQDVLNDPPFSRLDLVSRRNLLIYLLPEAQTKVISLFHFALRENGVLLLGSSETVVNADGRFEAICKTARIYRRIGHSRPGVLGFSLSDGLRTPARPGQDSAPSRQATLVEICRRLVMENYAPAAVLINSKHECLYYLGSTDRFLRVPTGGHTRDLLAIARPNIRTALRSAVQQATKDNLPIVVDGGGASQASSAFNVAVHPVLSDGEALLLVCFIDRPTHQQNRGHRATPRDASRVAELEHELEATQAELLSVIRDLETSNEQQKAINEEASSASEEFQSTNEELLTSKEELQSFNEELNALNTQLQETLERQRTTSNDLQNILNSTDVATIFLDTKLNIRFFTPATKALFGVIPSDIGRPLADLSLLADDSALLTEARAVLQGHSAVEREIEAQSGAWYSRRILPYRTQDSGVAGVVITFADITERRHITDALETAKREAQLANHAKSRFLAAASHDLRQPLQAMSLMRGELSRRIGDGRSEEALELVAQLEDTAAVVSGMLNTLLDINQIEAGAVHAEMVNFPIASLLSRLKNEFTYHAHAKNLFLRVVQCGQAVYSDPRLLEQMIRNLLSNALKYTIHGKVLLGCRRRGQVLSIEIWDTGAGIDNEEFARLFDEYHQLDNASPDRRSGLGLGLSIVKHLADLLGHRVRVRSQLGRGSVFAIDITLSPNAVTVQAKDRRSERDETAAEAAQRTGTILIIEDDPKVRDLLDRLLKEDGCHTATAPDGIAAFDLVARSKVRPDLILTDYNLPKRLNGLQIVGKVRAQLHSQIPAIVLTGDISTTARREIGRHDCVRLNKPVRLKELTEAVQSLLPMARSGEQVSPVHLRGEASDNLGQVVFIIDDDRYIRDGLRKLLEADGRTVQDFATCEAFLEVYDTRRDAGCLLVDACLPGMSGVELLQYLNHANCQLPAIMITGNGDVPMAVQAMKAGALDFIEKPFNDGDLRASVERALEQSRDSGKLLRWREAAANHIAVLTQRERQIMDLVVSGHPSKNIAADLGISQRTVEGHRNSIMKKTGAKSVVALARLAIAAAGKDADVLPSGELSTTTMRRGSGT